MSRRYGRMPESGSSEGRPADSDADAAKRRRSELLDRLVGKVQAAFWVALAGVVLHYGDILRTAVDPSKSNECVHYIHSLRHRRNTSKSWR